jgi:hypothetical protein
MESGFGKMRKSGCVALAFVVTSTISSSAQGDASRDRFPGQGAGEQRRPRQPAQPVASSKTAALELGGYLGASYTRATYSSKSSGDLGVSLQGRYDVFVLGGEYQFGDSDGDSSHYVGGVAGITLPLAGRTRLFALGNAGAHLVDKGSTYDLDLEGTAVNGDTHFDSPYAGGQVRVQLDLGQSSALVVNLIAHARFDLQRERATVSERQCAAIFCSDPTTVTYQVGGNAIGAGVGIGYEL